MAQTQAGVTGIDRATTRGLVSRIHSSPCRLVMHITGGGIVAITDLLVVSGASRSILEITVPYSPLALAELVGEADAGAVSEHTALALAEAALGRARSLGADANVAIGVGCTAALVTNRARRGSDVAHIATVTTRGVARAVVDLSGKEGDLNRSEQDRLVANAVIVAIDSACERLATM